jgi:serine phosphatase RsbU (regulator of sigma subunit)
MPLLAATTVARARRTRRREAAALPVRPRALMVGRPRRGHDHLASFLDVSAASPEEAWSLLGAGGVDVVLLDAGLPASRVRAVLAAAHKARPRPAVVAWTDERPGRRAAALAADADELIVGPVAPSEVLARVQAALRMRGYLDEIARQKAEMDDLRRQMEALAHRMAEDLRLAGGIQRSLLPPPVDHKHLDLAREYMPFRDIGGDYYDFVPLGAAGLALAVGDVMGKGVPAALLAATLKASVRSHLQTGEPSWCELVTRINRMFWEVTPVGLFASLFFGVFDASGRTFDYVNAGHFYPFILRRDGSVSDLENGGAVLGLVEEARYEAGRVHLSPGDAIVFYSDGVTERSNPDGEFYGIDRLKEAARRTRLDPARLSLYSILGELQGWSGGVPPEDDATLIVAKVR